MRSPREILALLCLGFACPAFAIVEQPAQPSAQRLPAPLLASDAVTQVDPGVATPAARAALAFAERYGGEWRFRRDVRSGRLALAIGSGIPLRVAAGLGETGDKTPGSTPSLQPEDVEPWVRAFLDRNATWLVPRVGTLVYDTDRSLVRQDGALISVHYAWHVDNVPVEGAGVFVGINHGNITRVAARFIGDPALNTTPQTDAETARRIALAYSDNPETSRIEEPQLSIQPEDTPDGRRAYRLVWKVRHVARGGFETWETRVDATTGRVVGFGDVNLYGRAVGGVYPSTVSEFNEVRVPFSGLAVEVDGTPTVTDSAGRFNYTGGAAITRMDGHFFDTDCFECAHPEQPVVRNLLGTGRLDLGVAGHDETGNGASTAADRNTFYHLNQARRVAAGWLPGLRWLGGLGFASNVNLPLECNAFFDGRSFNFYRSGGGCNNSGLIRDIIQHEWGHGLDSATFFSDGSTGEGTADVAAMHLSHSPFLAPGFFLDGGPLRILDASISPLGLLTRLRVNLGDCDRPLGGISFHCVGQLYGQAAWELAQMLVARHGHHTGWRVSERLFFDSLPDAGSMFPETTMSIYEAYLQADDDDGNLANGTPHAAEIHAAFAAHHIAGDPLPATEPCTGPQQPTVTVQAGCRRFDVSWNAVEGATRYRVLRSELIQDSTFFPVARVPGAQTGFVDAQVAPGMDYAYVVLAIDDAGCESTVEHPVPARLPAQPELSVSAVAVTDAPRGNRSGFADPGEEIDLEIALSNHGDLVAQTVSGTFRSLTPGVDISSDGVRWPSIPAGQSRVADRLLRLSTRGDAIACGDVLRLEMTPDDASACAGEASYFPVRIGQAVSRGEYVCDPAPACFIEPSFAGLESAAAGPSCGETALTWQAATSHCVDATVTYDIYRSSDPVFVPGPDNLLVARYEGTDFSDTGLEPGATYHYLVRAYDSRAAGDDNTVVRSVTAPERPDSGAPIFGGLQSAVTGETCGEVRLAWAAASESCSLPLYYDVYRSTEPDFEPGRKQRIATTESTDFLDIAPEPGRNFTYIVRARDAAGNSDGNTSARTAAARVFDRDLVYADFEMSDARWEVVEPNDAVRGTWEWGDPVGSEIQPEDDATIYGSKAWITGLTDTLDDGNNNDVDHGTTTLLSFRYDLDGVVDPVVRYMRWFTNDRLQNPGDPADSFRVHASNDDGRTWRLIEEVGAGTPLEWVPVEIPLTGLLHTTAEMRFRFTAADPGTSILDASGVEAGIDEFALIDRDQGCNDCPSELTVVDSVRVDRDGPDLVLTWTAEPVPNRRFIVERLSGRELQPLRLGTTAATTFTIAGGATGRRKHSYRVKSAGDCGPDKAAPHPPALRGR